MFYDPYTRDCTVRQYRQFVSKSCSQLSIDLIGQRRDCLWVRTVLADRIFNLRLPEPGYVDFHIVFHSRKGVIGKLSRAALLNP